MDAINVFSKKLELGLCDDWTPCERLLMYELIRKWNSCGRPHKFSATNTELAQNTGLSKPTIIRARKRLMARGGIEYIPTGNPRRAGRYSLEPLFKPQPEGTSGRPEKEQLNHFTTAASQANHSEGEQLNCDATVVSQFNHYQSNSNSGAPKGAAALPEKKKKKSEPPSTPAPLGRGSWTAKSEGEPRRVINAEGRVFQIWPRDGTGRRVAEEKEDGTLDEWRFEPSHSDEFIADILLMSIDEVKSG
ncbi:MAG: helix-turn-helix domain-containing protein [Bacteroides sp.]|nr:helix-turn-helix domain-containing protein [Bacteroides sp.]